MGLSRDWLIEGGANADPVGRTGSVEAADLDVNLTALERHTWHQLLDGQSISAIAASHGVTRAAIYARIRGTAKHPGGMVRKNPWVALWWATRQSESSL